MIKQLLSVVTLTALSVSPVFAGVNRISEDKYSAVDVEGETHYITYVRMDSEGDVQVKVTQNGYTDYYWVSCDDDRISLGGRYYDGWDYVDHRKMEGFYSDVACGRVDS